ncbi:ATP-binding protein [Schleiferilactobacillus harbinensis]|uniref:ATP-binding protein n=1 Tax=Schleiferilactobacillus harbinensis TaxID=304207 RepID=UPI0039EADFD1
MIERPYYLNQLISSMNNDIIKVITGVRRCGKSVLMMQYRDYLRQQGVAAEDIIYLNFEAFELSRIRTEDQLHDLLGERLVKERQQYLLIDEIQYVPGWQRVINGVRVSFTVDIVITGSNAMMLSGELATLLAGRYIQIPIYPLSFAEFLTGKGIDYDDVRRLDAAFREYEEYGGFPAVVTADNQQLKENLLSGIYNTILLKDVASRAAVRDMSVLESLTAYLADNVGQLVSVSKIVGTLNNEKVATNINTIDRYLRLLEDAFLFYRVQQYDLRGRSYLRTAGKYFIVDNGLRNTAVDLRRGNNSNRLENIVYLELLRRGYSVDVGRLDDVEIDFVARNRDDVQYVQVTYQLPNNTHETDNLLKVPDNYAKTVVTQQHYEITQVAGIPIVNVVDWLLAPVRKEQ